MSGGCSFARSFLAQEPRFGAGQVAQKSSFSMGFRNYVRRLFPRPRNAFWSGTSSSEILIFYGFSQITLEVFHRLFCAFSVLHCHGVSLSGGCGFARSFLAQEPRFGAGQVAQKSHFLWVSEVTLGTFSPPFLRLLRPSLPWCFPVQKKTLLTKGCDRRVHSDLSCHSVRGHVRPFACLCLLRMRPVFLVL